MVGGGRDGKWGGREAGGRVSGEGGAAWKGKWGGRQAGG